MGCCLSSSGEQRHCSDGGVAVEVEEAVKEVLQETSFTTRKLNAGQFIGENKELKVDGGFAQTPLINPSIQTEETVSDDKEYHSSNTSAHEKNGGEVNQRRPLRIRRQPIGDKRRVPPRTPVATDKTSQFRPSRGGQLRKEGSDQRSRPPITRGGRGTRRSLSGESENSGWSNGVVLGEEPETLENPVVSLECFIFL